MKVALVNNHLISTGVGRYSHSLYNSLRNNVEVDHYFIDKEKRALYKTSNRKLELIHKARKNALTDNNIFMKYKPSKLFLDYQLGKFVPSDYDIYHMANQNLSNLNYYPNIHKNIISVHDIFPINYSKNPLIKISHKLANNGLKRSDSLISVSNSTKSDLIKYFNISKEKIKVIHHGIDDIFMPLGPIEIENIRIKYNLDKNYRYILHIGKNIRKNLPVLVNAFYKLVKKFDIRNVKLLKINNMDRKSLELMGRLGLDKYIKIINYVPEEDLPKIYNLAELFVFPSLYEGFGFPPLEAMACGTPIITSNTSSIPEVVGNAGIMLQPNDIDGFAKAMYDVLMNENLRNDMVKNGLEQAKKFSWEKCARETLEVYEKTIE